GRRAAGGPGSVQQPNHPEPVARAAEQQVEPQHLQRRLFVQRPGCIGQPERVAPWKQQRSKCGHRPAVGVERGQPDPDLAAATAILTAAASVIAPRAVPAAALTAASLAAATPILATGLTTGIP